MQLMKWIILVVTALLVLLTACGGSEPTAAPVPPTEEESTSEAVVSEAGSPIPEEPTATPEPEPTADPNAAPEKASPSPTPEAAEGLFAPPSELADLRLTIVYDNYVFDSRLGAEWGFAAWIEYGGQVILFDTGGVGSILLSNMEILGLDPAAVEVLVLSHEHGDHTGGLEDLIAAGARPTIYVGASCANWVENFMGDRGEVIAVNDPVEIIPGIYSTGEMTGQVREQGMVIATRGGLVLVTGCAHPGIVRMIDRSKELVPGELALVVGGFHLANYSRGMVGSIVDGFQELGVQRVCPTHCSGDTAIEVFVEAYGDQFLEGGVGRIITVGAEGVAANPRPEQAASAEPFILEGVGLETPESVLFDPEADIYLVANINGSPGARDGNGFISQISPAGELQDLKWIDGTAEGVTLNAPKGMALTGDELWVADIDTVRIFDRRTGEPVGEVAVPGASFLNDVAADADGTVYVTDSTTGAIYRIAADRSFEEAARIAGPNGVQARGGLILVTASPGQILLLEANGAQIEAYSVPSGALDGLIWLEDGSMIVSSWAASAIYYLDPAGEATELFAGLPSPADIGFDSRRRMVLIPHFDDNRVETRLLP